MISSTELAFGLSTTGPGPRVGSTQVQQFRQKSKEGKISGK